MKKFLITILCLTEVYCLRAQQTLMVTNATPCTIDVYAYTILSGTCGGGVMTTVISAPPAISLIPLVPSVTCTNSSPGYDWIKAEAFDPGGGTGTCGQLVGDWTGLPGPLPVPCFHPRTDCVNIGGSNPTCSAGTSVGMVWGTSAGSCPGASSPARSLELN